MAVASLPMYDLAAVTEATNEWWKGLARAFHHQGIADIPLEISRGTDVRNLWTDSELLFSQTCGYPLIHELRQHVQLVATPCYEAPGCNASDYSSVVIVPAKSNAGSLQDLKGTICAVNRRDSHSGCNVLRRMIAPLAKGMPFFESVKISGHHRESLLMLMRGEADIAAIDCVTFALIVRHEPHIIESLRILCYSPPAPGLPFVTSSSNPEAVVRRLRAGVEMAFSDGSLAACRKVLMLSGFRVLSLPDYHRIAEFETEAIAWNYPELQ